MCRTGIFLIFQIILGFGNLFCQTLISQEENKIISLREDIIKQNDWAQVYPNPSFGIINISSMVAADVYIISTTGDYVQNEHISADYPLEMELKKGQYIINIKSQEQILVKRIIVN